MLTVDSREIELNESLSECKAASAFLRELRSQSFLGMRERVALDCVLCSLWWRESRLAEQLWDVLEPSVRMILSPRAQVSNVGNPGGYRY